MKYSSKTNRSLTHSFFSTLKGDQGENQVKKLLEKHGYQCLHDILIQRAKKTPVQIDHLVMTFTALHVLETKHYKGHIQGYLSEPMWHQTFSDNDKSYLIPNAFRQNSLHCLVIQKRLGRKNHIPIRNHVVFTGSCSLSGDIASHITNLNQLPELLGSSKINSKFENVWNILNNIIKQDNGNLQKLSFQASLLFSSRVKDS